MNLFGINPDPYHIEQMDSIDFLLQLANESVDLVVIDPAYESLEKHRAVGTTTRLKKKWFPIFPNSRYPALLAQLYRVMKKNTHCYIMCDEDTRDVIKPLAIAAGFKFWKSLIWDRSLRGMGYHYPASHEYILFLEKGKRKLATNDYLDVLHHPDPELEEIHEFRWPDSVLTHRSVSRKKDAYATEKPRSLLDVLISESSAPGEIVLDVAIGSGVTGDSAIRLGRRFIGCDISDASMAVAVPRLEQACLASRTSDANQINQEPETVYIQIAHWLFPGKQHHEQDRLRKLRIGIRARRSNLEETRLNAEHLMNSLDPYATQLEIEQAAAQIHAEDAWFETLTEIQRQKLLTQAIPGEVYYVGMENLVEIAKKLQLPTPPDHGQPINVSDTHQTRQEKIADTSNTNQTQQLESK